MDQGVVMATTTFFNRLEEAEFCKTIEQKWCERMENCVRNDDQHFEKESRQNCNSDTEKKVTKFALIFFW